LLIGLLAISIAINFPKNETFKRKLFFTYSAIITLVVGFLGLVLFFMAFFTDHLVTYHNENLLLANPATFIIFVLSVIAIFKPSFKVVQNIKWLWYFLAATTILLLILKIIPGFNQDNLMIISLLLPMNFAFAFAFYKKDLFKS